MKTLKRILSQNFWYDVALQTTIASTLKRHGAFSTKEVQQVFLQYKKLYQKNRDRVNDIPSEYHVSWSSMIAAIYLTLRERDLGVAEAVDLTGSLIFQNMGSESVAQFISSALDKARDRFAFIVNSSKQQEAQFFGNTFDFHRPQDDGKAYRLRVRGCLYNDFFRANGLPELMSIACRWDMVSWSKGIDRERHGVAFTRPRTLGLDGVECEFDFENLR